MTGAKNNPCEGTVYWFVRGYKSSTDVFVIMYMDTSAVIIDTDLNMIVCADPSAIVIYRSAGPRSDQSKVEAVKSLHCEYF